MDSPGVSIEYLAHASVLIRSGTVSLLTDPWLTGTKYYGSWHHFPPAVYAPETLQRVQYVYLSHWHQDHFDPPSLRLVNPEATILIPRFANAKFLQKVRAAGFSRILELVHKRWVDVGPDLRASCLIIGEDSALLFRVGDRLILDANDCNIHPHLAWIEQQKVDTMLATFTVAYAFPFACTFEEEQDVDQMAEEKKCLNHLMAALGRIRPRFFIPFAGQFAFLREDEFRMNYLHNTPLDVAASASRLESLRGMETVLLNPGDTLCSDGTVARGTEFRWEERDRYLQELVTRARAAAGPSPRAAFANGASRADAFARMLTAKLKANPSAAVRCGLRVIFSFNERIEFDRLNPLAGLDSPLLCDFAARRVSPVLGAAPRTDFDLIVNIPASLLPELLADEVPWDSLCISCRLRLFFRKHISSWDSRIEALGIVLDTPPDRSRWGVARQRLNARYLQALLTRRDEYWQRLKYKLRLA